MLFDIFFKKEEEVPQSSSRKLDDFDRHLELTLKIGETYKKRVSDPDAIQKTVDLCFKQIALSEKSKQAWIKEDKEIGILESTLPMHKGYTQLCIILEKDKKFNEVIAFANKAKDQGWNGDWDKRISRCRKKIIINKKHDKY